MHPFRIRPFASPSLHPSSTENAACTMRRGPLLSKRPSPALTSSLSASAVHTAHTHTAQRKTKKVLPIPTTSPGAEFLRVHRSRPGSLGASLSSALGPPPKAKSQCWGKGELSPTVEVPPCIAPSLDESQVLNFYKAHACDSLVFVRVVYTVFTSFESFDL
jgi:hypothetical protein